MDEFVQATNKRLDENNNKLDLLIDLARQMAILQEKQDHNAEDLRKMDQRLAADEGEMSKMLKTMEERVAKIEADRVKSNERVHKRIDEVQQAAERYEKDHDNKTEAIIKAINDKLSDQNAKLKDLNDDYKNRVSFFKGIFFAFAIFSSVGQAMLYRYFGKIETSISDSAVAIQKLENRFNETERQIDMIHNTVRSLKK